MTQWITLSEQYLALVKIYIPNFNKAIMPKNEYKLLHGIIQKKITQQAVNRNFQVTKDKEISRGSTVVFEGKKYKVKQITDNGKVHIEGRKSGAMVSPLSCELSR